MNTERAIQELLYRNIDEIDSKLCVTVLYFIFKKRIEREDTDECRNVTKIAFEKGVLTTKDVERSEKKLAEAKLIAGKLEEILKENK